MLYGAAEGSGRAGNDSDEGINLEACWVTSPVDETEH